MKIFLVKHAESIGIQNGILQGHKDYKLSEKGIKESQLAAQRFKNIKFKAIFSSDLSRAKETAKIIAKFHKNVPIYFSQLLRERNLGEFQGKKKKEIDNWNKIREKLITQRPKGGETYGEVKKRAKSFLQSLLKKYPNDTVLAVTHGGFIRMTYSVITKQLIKKCAKEIFLSNTCVNEIEILSDKSYKIIRKNCIKHL